MLKVRNLSSGYRNMTIVRDVSFDVDEGQIMGIVGESGCGKSTLLKSINLLPGTGIEIKGGSVEFCGRELTSLGREDMRGIRGRQICMIFQKPQASMDPITKVSEQFYEAVCVHDSKAVREDVLRRAEDILEKLHFEDPDRILSSYPFELSGGMNQRVALALAMINSPKLILADEPTSALDVTVQSQVIRLIREIRDLTGMSVVIVSHNINVMSALTDRIGVMYGGMMVEYAARDEIMQRSVHPYTRALLASVPVPDGTLPRGIEGKPPSFGESAERCPFAPRCPLAKEECLCSVPPVTSVSDTHRVRCHRASEK